MNLKFADWRAVGVAALFLFGMACEKREETVEGIHLAGDFLFSIPSAELVPVDEKANLWLAERQLVVKNGGPGPAQLILPRQKMVVTSPGSRTVSWKSWEPVTDYELASGQALTIELGRFGGEDPSPEMVVQLVVEIDGVLYPITVKSEPAVRRSGKKTS